MSGAAGFPTLNWSAVRIGSMEIKIIILICAWAAFSVYLIASGSGGTPSCDT
jgi:integral membrane sensor domain MASE1